jgi:hypothetical protein
MAWIRNQVDPEAPDDTHIVIGIDYSEPTEIGDRAVSLLLNSSMEGDEGVFYVLPYDLCYNITRSAGVVTVDLLTPLTTLTAKGTLDLADWDRAKAAGLIPQHARQRETVGAAPNDDAPIEWITVLSATIPFPEDAALPGPPLVLIDHEGVAGLDELLAAIPDSGIQIVGPKPDA